MWEDFWFASGFLKELVLMLLLNTMPSKGEIWDSNSAKTLLLAP